MDLLILVIGWFIFSVIIGEVAAKRGRSSVGWFLFALLFSPLIAGFAVALMPANEQGLIDAGKLRRCPNCAETVKADAIVCRYCGRELPPFEASERTGRKVLAVAIGLVLTAVILFTIWYIENYEPSKPAVVATASSSSSRVDVTYRERPPEFTVAMVKHGRVVKTQRFRTHLSAHRYIESLNVAGGAASKALDDAIVRGKGSAPVAD